MKSLITKPIKVKPEGREGIYIVEPDVIADYIESLDVEYIHSLIANDGSMVFIGADISKQGAIERIKSADTVAFTFPHQLKHALVVITGYNRELFDLGEVDESMMDTSE